jgi:hypothetical protein
MHKLMPLTKATAIDAIEKLHYVPAGATACVACHLSAPRMRMFYTDDAGVYTSVDMGEPLTPHTLPWLVDSTGRRVRVEVCSPCPF